MMVPYAHFVGVITNKMRVGIYNDIRSPRPTRVLLVIRHNNGGSTRTPTRA